MAGIFPTIFTRLDSFFKAGEGAFAFLTKTPTCTMIYLAIFTRINSFFKAGEAAFAFLTKTPTCTMIYLALRDVKATPWKAAVGAARRFDELTMHVLLAINQNNRTKYFF